MIEEELRPMALNESRRQVALLGAGRIGVVHARALAQLRDVELRYVMDVDETRCKALTSTFGGEPATLDEILADTHVSAVIIATPTNTHAELMVTFAREGKAIFCEKPVDIDRERVLSSLRAVEESGVPFALGFMRRYDPTYRRIYERILAGDIGIPEQVTIFNRDVAPPPIDFVRASGGLVRDMTSHDVDLASWLLGEDLCTAFASGSCLIDPRIGQAGDVDSLAVVLTTATGKLVQISESRRSAYGYDQRVEVLGSQGMLQAGNKLESLVLHGGSQGLSSARPLNFFLERYEDAYLFQLRDFFESLEAGRRPAVGVAEARRALFATEAVLESMRTGARADIEQA